MDGSMLNRFFLALALTAGLLSPSYSAGTIGLSLTQRFDPVTAKPLNGGKLYFIQAGTTSTPQNAFQDSALTIPWPNPITLDAGGNIPQLFFADGQIKIRLTSAAGVTQIVADNILVVGASSGGGGGGTVDPTTIMQPGHVEVFYGTGVLTGFVRANGRTIGSATSGATERANADTSALFAFLWGADANLAVSGGRGASAAADYAANKTLTLPDWRGRSIAGLDDMGSSAAGRLTASYFGTAATVLGAAGGAEKQTIATSQVPTITSSNAAQSITVNPLGSTGFFVPYSNASWFSTTTPATGAINIMQSGGSLSFTSSFSGTNNISVTSNNTGGGSPTPVVTAQPTMLATIYLKL
jgi:hypothetical protein